MTDGPAREECAICGQSNDATIETHHLVPQRPPYNGSDHPDNLVKLCGSCHNAVERIYDDDFFRRVSSKTPQFSDGEEAGELGHRLDARRSCDRSFPKGATHVEFETTTRSELVELGLVDRDQLETESVEERIEWREQQLSDLKRELSNERGSSQDQNDESADEESFSLGGQAKAGSRSDAQKLETSITNVRSKLEWLRAEFESGDEILVGADWELQLIHCGYCDTVFLGWEAADAAKHLQLSHHIDDPYEQKTVQVVEEHSTSESSPAFSMVPDRTVRYEKPYSEHKNEEPEEYDPGGDGVGL